MQLSSKKISVALFGIPLAIATALLVSNCGGGNDDLSSSEKNAQKKLKEQMGIADEDAPPVDEAPEEMKGQEVAVLTNAPNVPPPITRKHRTKVIVNLEVSEKVMRMADGVDYTFWTFGGVVPGKFIRVREGDFVEFHLANHPDSKMPHNIDLHAVTGPGGGATSSFTAPGHESVFSFTALNPGLYVYHCATAPVGMHIANGMYGLILVDPKEGLPPVDREFYVFQSEFYTKGPFGEAGLQPFSMDKALREEADYVVFNGSVDSTTGDKSMPAKVGETVRLFVGNGGPNLVSSFHVIGEIFDKVYVEGGSTANKNVQTTMIPAGGSAIVEFKLEVPGTFIIVDHSIFRAFNKGAIAMIKVEGEENTPVYTGKIDDRIYLAEGGAVLEIPQDSNKPAPAANKEEQIARGHSIYTQVCVACHQAEGQGIPSAFPPLAKSDYLNADVDRAIGTVLHGLTGEVTVNEAKYNSIMPLLNLPDESVANVLTYVYNKWDNNGTVVTPEMVKAVRAKGRKLMKIPRLVFSLLLVTDLGICAEEGDMATLPAGSYLPLYMADPKPREVAAFQLDIHPVTNAQFLEFVRENPKWRRSNAKRIFTDTNYLKHWAGDLDLGPDADKVADSPVTNISWFAARAYLKSKGKRLPTTDEWEDAAAADETRADATDDPAFTKRLLEWYGRPNPETLPSAKDAEPNFYGVKALHGYVWEWVGDFNNSMVTGESRGDSGLDRKLYCAGGALGATDTRNYAAFMRYAFRSSLKGNYTVPNLGFRGAKDIPNK